MSETTNKTTIETVALRTWTPRGNVVLTITSEGRVVPGDGMQMDDVAREFLAACDVYTNERDAEVARLRERVAELERAMTWAHCVLAESDCVEDRCIKAMDMLDAALAGQEAAS